MKTAPENLPVPAGSPQREREASLSWEVTDVTVRPERGVAGQGRRLLPRAVAWHSCPHPVWARKALGCQEGPERGGPSPESHSAQCRRARGEHGSSRVTRAVVTEQLWTPEPQTVSRKGFRHLDERQQCPTPLQLPSTPVPLAPPPPPGRSGRRTPCPGGLSPGCDILTSPEGRLRRLELIRL